MKLSKKILISAGVIFVLDRLLKYWTVKKLPAEGIFVFEKFGGLGLKFSQNTGIAFGIPLHQVLVYIFLIFCFLVLMYLIIQSWRKKNQVLFLALVIILLGALSNLIDRMVYGYVVDYINIFIWPTFNVADIMIVGGVLGWLVYEVRSKKSEV